MRRSSCAGCGLDGLAQILDLGSSPLADRFPADDRSEEKYPLQLAICEYCGLAQLLHLVPDKELFGEDYGFLTGSSPSSIRYFEDWAKWALTWHHSGTRQIMEIACNDGTLLKNFQGTGNKLLGVEPAMPAADHAREAGLEIEKALFTEDYAEEILDKHGKAGLIIGCNVVAHVPDPVSFLRGVRMTLAKDGIAVFEFQAFDDLVADGQFDLVYHEHRFFYSLPAFTRVAHTAGLTVLDYIRTPAQSGSFRVILGRQGDGIEIPKDEQLIRESFLLQSRADRVKDRLLTMLYDYQNTGKSVAGYGASAKSATLLNFCGIDSSLVRWVTDVTPSKIGKLTPGSHIPIIDELKPANAYLLFVRNYLSGVLRRESKYLEAGGKFIVPIPTPVVI